MILRMSTKSNQSSSIITCIYLHWKWTASRISWSPPLFTRCIVTAALVFSTWLFRQARNIQYTKTHSIWPVRCRCCCCCSATHSKLNVHNTHSFNVYKLRYPHIYCLLLDRCSFHSVVIRYWYALRCNIFECTFLFHPFCLYGRVFLWLFLFWKILLCFLLFFALVFWCLFKISLQLLLTLLFLLLFTMNARTVHFNCIQSLNAFTNNW